MTEYKDLSQNVFIASYQLQKEVFLQQNKQQIEFLNQTQRIYLKHFIGAIGFYKIFKYPKSLWYLSIEMFPRKNKNICKIIWKKVWFFFKK